MQTLLQKRTEILLRPGFRLYESDGTKIVDAINQAINVAYQEYYETNRNLLSLLEKTTVPGSLFTMTGGVNWGANGKMFSVASADLPTDLAQIKKLWIINNSDAVTYSSSTYDLDGVEGSGIPDSSDNALSLTNVYHEISGSGSGKVLLIYVGTTAAGSTTKLGLTYTPTWTALSSDSDVIQVPDYDIITTFNAIVDKYLTYYIGFSE